MKSAMIVQRNGIRGRCRLCQNLGGLIHSHVISRLMFRPMGQLGQQTPLRFDPVGGTDRPGHLKEYMLCERCEIQFSRYERIAGQFFADLNGLQLPPDLKPVFQLSLDYGNIKLFFLSLIWRCAVCEDPITGKIGLGERLAYLTDLLRTSNPGTENEFPIILRMLAESPEAKHAVLTVPVPMRNAKRRGFAMIGNGVEISWITDKRGASHECVAYILRQDGSWQIDVVRGFHSPPWVQAVKNASEKDRNRTP